MIKRLFPLLFAVMALLVAACQPTVEGSGVATSETRDAFGFNRLSVSIPGTVEIVQGESEFVTIEGDDNIAPLVEAAVRRGTLLVRTRSLEGRTVSLRPKTPLFVRIGVRELFAIDISGSANVGTESIESDRFSVGVSGSGAIHVLRLSTLEVDVDISGSGDVVLGGTALKQRVTVSGSGSYDGRSLLSKEAMVSVSGSGGALVNAEGALEATVSGSGTIRYLGDPAVKEKVSGSGDVQHLRS